MDGRPTSGLTGPPRRSRRVLAQTTIGSHQSALLGRVPLPARRRCTVGPGRSGPPAAGPGRARGLAGSAARRDGTQGGRGAAAGSELVQARRSSTCPRSSIASRPTARCRYLDVSPQVREMLGYTPEEWTTSQVDFWAEQIHPDDAPSVLAANKHANATKEPFGAEYRIQHADGSAAGGSTTRRCSCPTWTVVLAGVHARHQRTPRAEDQLREAEVRFPRSSSRTPRSSTPRTSIP